MQVFIVQSLYHMIWDFEFARNSDLAFSASISNDSFGALRGKTTSINIWAAYVLIFA